MSVKKTKVINNRACLFTENRCGQIRDYASISTLPASEGIFGGSLAVMPVAHKAASESMGGLRPTMRDGEGGVVDASALDIENELKLNVEC